MATWEAVRRVANALPEVTESAGTTVAWRVKGKAFVWERPLRKADHAALGAAAPDGEVLAAYVPDLGDKAALVADGTGRFFATPHFDGYPIVLVRLDEIGDEALRELLVDAWRSRAPKRLAAELPDGA